MAESSEDAARRLAEEAKMEMRRKVDEALFRSTYDICAHRPYANPEESRVGHDCCECVAAFVDSQLSAALQENARLHTITEWYEEKHRQRCAQVYAALQEADLLSRTMDEIGEMVGARLSTDFGEPHRSDVPGAVRAALAREKGLREALGKLMRQVDRTCPCCDATSESDGHDPECTLEEDDSIGFDEMAGYWAVIREARAALLDSSRDHEEGK